MKKLLLLLSLTALTQIIHSQEIILTFQPADGAFVIDSVKTTNPATSQVSVTDGAEITMPDETTSVKIPGNDFHEGKVYPNPFNEYTSIQFATANEEDIVVAVTNASGQVVLRQQKHLLQGMHRVQLSIKSQGMYFITIAGKDNASTFKAVSLQGGGSKDMISWLGSSPVEVTEKSAKAEEGKLFHFEIYSGENVTVIADSPTESKTYEVEFHECKDPDGKNYKIVQIGEQWWMAENLAYLPLVSSYSQVSDIAARYYVYDYQGTNVAEAKITNNYNIYGVLYNWPAAMAGACSSNTNPSRVKGICPEGWHLPSKDEWTQLNLYLTANGYNFDGTTTHSRIAKSLAATTHWNLSTNTGAVGNNLVDNDKSGFTALPGGVCRYSGFFDVGKTGSWWSTTCQAVSSDDYVPFYLGMDYNYYIVSNVVTSPHLGLSIRCIRDSEEFASIATLETGNAALITQTSATLIGSITSNGGAKVT